MFRFKVYIVPIDCRLRRVHEALGSRVSEVLIRTIQKLTH